ncbi:MAG: Ribosomal large subunit pseudouridine synthase [Chlamydiota bacterium]|jgi:23S rRNA pseudouridine1911/1915/1917 synthase
MQEDFSMIVAETDKGVRLDKLLALRFPMYSRTYFQFLIDSHSVLVNGIPVKKRAIVSPGDHIEAELILTPELSLEPEPIPLNIIYEDSDLLVVNKPAGLVVHPAVGHPKGTFVNALLFHCRSLAGTDPLRPGIVHRLDKDTSGLLVAAKHLQAHSALVALFASRAIHKEYLAICVGKPQEGLISAPIGRNPLKRQQMCVDPIKGKKAESIITLIDSAPPLSFVRIQLLTGRTHQIRVHLKHLNTPVLGDPVYGSSSSNEKFSAPRQLLHAHRLCFEHPFTKKQLDLIAPVPSDMEPFTNKFNKKITTR